LFTLSGLPYYPKLVQKSFLSIKNLIDFSYLEFGQERSEQLSDQSADNVLKKIEGLVKQ